MASPVSLAAAMQAGTTPSPLRPLTRPPACRRKQDDPGISLRFKYGPQTVFLFVQRSATFAQISEQLYDVLRQSYPRGLAVSTARPGDVTPVPSKDDEAQFQIAYAVPKNPRDLAAGWNRLSITALATPASLKLRENTALAFSIQPAAEDAPPSFVVEMPPMDEEE